jgi:NAD(P)-dependent dehydrogenase (short-subunit alcohol dehydrogenase family)
MADLDGKVAFVTGAGSGVGIGLAIALAKAGASVGLFGRTRSTLEETAEKITSLGGKTVVCPGDVMKRADVDAAVAQTQKILGPIWVLVNNAATISHQLLEQVDDKTLDIALHSNVYGSLYTMQACFPTMKERGGRIINFGSGASTMGMPVLAAYNIAKEGVRGLTKTAASDWGKYGITVNTICPLATTASYEAWWKSLTEQEKQDHLGNILLGRMGDPEKDVGALCVFLAGPGGGFLTSRTFHVDGGRCYYDR